MKRAAFLFISNKLARKYPEKRFTLYNDKNKIDFSRNNSGEKLQKLS